MNFTIQQENNQLFSALALASSQTSSPINVKECLCYSIQVTWTGGTLTAGNIIVEATNYPVDDPTLSPVYTIILTEAVSATSGDFLLNIERAGYTFARVRWVPSAGTTGTISAFSSTKRL